jgi:hypothetical protein
MHPPRRRWPLYAALALVAAGAIVAGVLALGGSKGENRTNGRNAAASGGVALALSGVGAYDPVGGDGEHDSDAPLATDGNAASYWQTEHYNSGLGKDGVGIVVDAGRSVAAKSITVSSDTPAFTATVLAGASPNGPFSADASSQQVGSRTTFALRGHSARYYVLWITDLGTNRSVHVNELKARS